MLPPQVQDGRWKAVREMTNPLADQGRRGSPRYHPACPGIAGPLGIALTGETAADYSWFTGGACPPWRDGRRVRAGGDAPRGPRHGALAAPCRAHTLPGSLADVLVLLLKLLISCKVDPVGFEPTTFSMPLRRAPNCAMGPWRASQWTWRDSNPRPLQCD